MTEKKHLTKVYLEELMDSKSHFEGNISRRSIDWRDSGIVIDDDFQFNSIDYGSTFLNSSRGENIDRNINYLEDEDGDTILHLAVVGCTVEKAKDLIQMCDLDAINNMIQTPLHVATMANRPEMVELLLNSGAKPNVHDRRGNTALHLSCEKGFKEIASIILNFIARISEETRNCLTLKQFIELTNFDGHTCLHLAALNDKREILELLVNEYDANLNCQDSRSGETILHKAICMFNVDLVAFIVGFKKHCNQSDYSGRKPLDTIRLLQDSRIDKTQFGLLVCAEKLIKDRIITCGEQNGCCFAGITESVDSPPSPSSSSSLSSENSESDSDMS